MNSRVSLIQHKLFAPLWHRAGGALVLSSALIGVLVLAPSWYMLEVYDRVVGSRNLTTLTMLSLGMLLLIGWLELIEWHRAELLRSVTLALDRLLAERVGRAAFERVRQQGMQAGHQALAALQSASDGSLGVTLQATALGTVAVSGMTASTTYNRAATMADSEGCWQIAGDAVSNQFCVSSAGVVSGYRGACQLAGTISLRPESKAVVTASVQESVCPEAVSYSGIGVFARSGGVVVEDARMLALKSADATVRSLLPLQRLVQN